MSVGNTKACGASCRKYVGVVMKISQGKLKTYTGLQLMPHFGHNRGIR